mgnify:FL=1
MKTNFDRTCRTGAKTRDGKLEQQPGDNFLQMKDNEKGHSVNADGINPGGPFASGDGGIRTHVPVARQLDFESSSL